MLLQIKLLQSQFFTLDMKFIFDFYSVVFSFTVIMITSCVMLYSKFYMKTDLNQSRFYKLVMGFVLSMIIMIFSSNLFFMLMGWDGLGMLSFLLVIFYQNEQSLGSGLITFFSNRMGDAFLLMLIGLLSLNQEWTWYNSFTILTLLLLMLTSITKSAQIPFSSWLPRAMAAPTPISSLVHSSTLVTAGVFLLIRFSNELDYSLLLILGIMTSLYAGLSGWVEHDLKKIIALSTLSQLGIMFVSLGLNCPNITFFHLLTHAFFKSMIFICAGNMISSHQNMQDTRLYGNMYNMSQMSSMFFMSGSFALMGIPFLAGFYSKDAILENFMNSNYNMWLSIMVWLSILTTSIYSTRLMMSTTWNPTMMTTQFFMENLYVIFPISLLNLGGMTSGSILSYFLYYNSFFSDIMFKLLPIMMMMLGILLMMQFWTYEMKNMFLSQFGFLNSLTNHSTFYAQNQLYKTILMTEQGWMESFPMFMMKLMKYIKELNMGISLLILTLIYLL